MILASLFFFSLQVQLSYPDLHHMHGQFICSVIDLKRDPWPRISYNANDLVTGMLNQAPKRRLTTHQVLGCETLQPLDSADSSITCTEYFLPDHPWLQNIRKANVNLGV